MNPVILIILMVLLGAMIGGVTNSLAIKMLFRPYRSIYIGKFRIPFTPGLIPKRQQELAKQLGKMVVNHLLTPEGLRRKLERPAFQEQMTKWAQDEVQQFIEKTSTMEELLSEAGIYPSVPHIESSVSEWINEQYQTVMKDYRHRSLNEVLTDQWIAKAEMSSDQLADYIQEKVTLYFKSAEGRQKVTALIENYLDNQGFFGGMITSFMGSDGLTERIYPVILRYVSDPEMKAWLRGMLRTELHHVMNQPISDFEEKIGKEAVGLTLGKAVAKSLPLDEWLSRSIVKWTKPYQEKIIEDFVPIFVKKVSGILSGKIESMMSSMHLSEIVQEEVEAFQVHRLEDMILGISRREFKMITYLGALLGGLIGILQGMIVIFFG